MLNRNHDSATRRRGWLPVLSAVLVLAACSPEDPGPPYSALVYEYDLETSDYSLQEVELPTLGTLRGLDGDITNLIGGVDLAVDAFAVVETEDDLVDAIKVRGGRPVDVRWFLQGEVVVPEDFGSLLLFTYYRNMERCSAFFHEHGVPGDVPGKIPTFHLPTFGTILLGGFQIISDNAGFASALGAFALFPRSMLLDRLPLAMNPGVVCHEYSHAVFHSLVAGDALAPAGTLVDWPIRAENLIRSVDEGFADLAGALATDNPVFLDPSVPAAISSERDLSIIHEFDDAMDSRLERRLFYDPYPLGSVFASTLWRVRLEIGTSAAAQSLVEAMELLGEVAGPDLEISTVTDVLYETMVEEGRGPLCESLEEALLPLPDDCQDQ